MNKKDYIMYRRSNLKRNTFFPTCCDNVTHYTVKGKNYCHEHIMIHIMKDYLEPYNSMEIDEKRGKPFEKNGIIWGKNYTIKVDDLNE